jgi:hypothetical protein
MNEGGIASLMSNGGLEAMMLELEGEAPFDMQEAYDEELGILDPADSFGSLSPELMEMIGEMIMPGAGMVKMGKGVTKVGEKGLRELRKMLNMGKHSPKGDPRPPILGTERSKPPEIPKYIPEKDATTHLKQAISKTKKPPKMWYGGAPLYKKGYYGKSYK